ncbi:MAG: PspC domain-containing protein [Thermoanaerobacteraceae bacterium]|nr:PspC domain-containing protein [Thermoanaerobacteraceae bacterium]
MDKKLYRSRNQKILGGVCGGITEYFDADVTIVRLVWVLISLFNGAGLILYIIAWIIIPENPYQINEPHINFKDEKTDNTQYKNNGSEIFGWILIGLGLISLIRIFIPTVSFNLFWPILLIAIGIVIIMKKM